MVLSAEYLLAVEDDCDAEQNGEDAQSEADARGGDGRRVRFAAGAVGRGDGDDHGAIGVEGTDAEGEQRGQTGTEKDADDQDLPQGMESCSEDVHGGPRQAAILMGPGVSDGARLPSQSAVTLTGVICVRRDR